MRKLERITVPGGQRERGGFTLFEVLIAMALSAILVAAVYTALSMHISRTQSAYADVEQTGVARGVLRKIGADLRTALYQVPESPQQQAGAAEGGAAAGNGTEAPEQEAEPIETMTRELGLWGESDWILFDVGLPLRRLSTAESAAADLQSSTAMHMVLYALDEAAQDQEAGLVRKEVSREQAELTGFDLGAIFDAAELTELLAAEVKQLEFRYYDGFEWQSSWDSSLMLGLPRAVEVLIGVEAVNGEQQDVPYRVVIALPTPSANRVHDDYQLLQPAQGEGP